MILNFGFFLIMPYDLFRIKRTKLEIVWTSLPSEQHLLVETRFSVFLHKKEIE